MIPDDMITFALSISRSLVSFDHGPVPTAHLVSMCTAADLVRLPRGGVRLGPADHLQHNPRPVALERLHPQQRQCCRLHGRGAGGAIHPKGKHSLDSACPSSFVTQTRACVFLPLINVIADSLVRGQNPRLV